MRDVCVYLRGVETDGEARAGLGRWIASDNADRPHSALGGVTPDEAHAGIAGGIALAA